MSPKRKKIFPFPPENPKTMRCLEHNTTMVVLCRVLSVAYSAEKIRGHFSGHPNPLFSVIFYFKALSKNRSPEKGTSTPRLYCYCCCCCFHVTTAHSETGDRNLKNTLHGVRADGLCCFLEPSDSVAPRTAGWTLRTVGRAEGR